MSAAKHTPGPWAVCTAGRNGRRLEIRRPYVLTLPDGRREQGIGEPVATVVREEKSPAAYEANAHVMAAGPEMRAALYEALRWLPDPDENPLERFERIADDYYRDTGRLRPGKAEPMDSCHMDSEERERLFAEWAKERSRRVLAIARAAVAKAEGRS